MTAKEHLSELERIKVKIQQKQEQKQIFLEMATSITVSLNPVKVQKSSTLDRMGNAVLNAADMDALIDEEINNLWYRQNEIVKQIQKLRDAKYIQLLFKIYIQGKSIKETSVEMGMSYPHVKRLHQNALLMFEDVHADILAERTAV